MERSKRLFLLHFYRIAVGLAGVILLIVFIHEIPWGEAGLALAFFAFLSLVIKRAGFHIAPGITHSLVGIVDVAVLLLFGSASGGMVAALSGLAYLLLRSWRRRTGSWSDMVEVALFNTGLKVLIAFASGWAYFGASGHSLSSHVEWHDIWPLFVLFTTWFVLDHVAWGIAEGIRGGVAQVFAFLRTVWSTSLLVEFLPLWTAVIIAFVYRQGNVLVFALLSFGIVAVSVVVQRLADMWQQVQQRLVELTALSQVGQAIVSAQLDVDQLCELIYEQASQIVDTSSFHLGLFDGDAYTLKIWVKDDARQPSQTFSLANDDGIIGWMRQSKQPLLVRDFSEELDSLPAKPRYNSDRPPRSAVFVPLLAGEKVIGTMAIQNFEPGAFTQDHLRLLSVVGNQAAVAIEKARLYVAERLRARQLALIEDVSRKVAAILDLETLFSQVVHLIQKTFEYYHVGIFSLVPGEAELHFEASTNPDLECPSVTVQIGEGIVGHVAETGESLLINDVRSYPDFIYEALLPHTCAELAVPLKAEGRVLAVLDVQSDKAEMLDKDDLFVLQTLASQIAIAITEARLYTAQQEDAWIATALLQVAEATSKLGGLTDVLDTVVRLTPMLTGVDRCGILLWNEDLELFVPAQAYGLTAEQYNTFVAMRLTPDEAAVLEQVCQAKESVILSGDQVMALPASMVEAFDIHNLLILPLLAHGQSLGVMLVDYVEEKSALGGRRFTDRKVSMIAGITNQAAIAIDNAQLLTAKQEEAYVSTALLQVAEAVRSSTDLADILDIVVRITPILTGVQRCAILLWDDQEQGFFPVRWYGFSEDELVERRLEQDDPLAQHILAGQAAVGMPLDAQDRWVLDDVAVVTSEFDVLSLPLIAKDQVLGTMLVDYVGAPAQFASRWMNILQGIVNQTAIAIENTQLYRQEAERQRLQRELQVARQIQASFLPEKYPSMPGWELDAYWQSAYQVGGDFYDLFTLTDGRLGLIIADVADKGIPAALFMALSRTLVRVVAQEISMPTKVLERTNDLIISDTHSDLFVTVFYGILDPETGTFVYANGGHNPPLLVRQCGDVESLRAKGIVLGIVSPIHLEEKSTQMQPGDMLVMYTDGVTDAINAEEEEFGTSQLSDIVRRMRDQEPGEVISTIHREVAEFTGDMPQFDDFTLLVLKRTIDTR